MDPVECERLARTARVARLATLRPDSRPDLVPIVFAFVDDALVFAVDRKPKTTTHLQRLRNIAHQPDVAVLFDHYDDADWSRLWWVRMRGNARVIEDAEASVAALDALAERYPPYRDDRPPGPVVRIDPTGWHGWMGR